MYSIGGKRQAGVVVFEVGEWVGVCAAGDDGDGEVFGAKPRARRRPIGRIEAD